MAMKFCFKHSLRVTGSEWKLHGEKEMLNGVQRVQFSFFSLSYLLICFVFNGSFSKAHEKQRSKNHQSKNNVKNI